MTYTVEVDLSAKLEQWTKNTAVAFSDGIQGTILITSRVKREAREWLRDRYPKRSKRFYRYLLFAALVFLAIQPHLQQIGHVIIDRDYPGQQPEGQIKSRLLQFLHREDPKLRGDFVSFRELKGARADILARDIYQRNKKADRLVSLDDIRQVFE